MLVVCWSILFVGIKSFYHIKANTATIVECRATLKNPPCLLNHFSNDARYYAVCETKPKAYVEYDSRNLLGIGMVSKRPSKREMENFRWADSLIP